MKFKLFIITIMIFFLSNLLFSWTWPLSNSSEPGDADTFTSAFVSGLILWILKLIRKWDRQVKCSLVILYKI